MVAAICKLLEKVQEYNGEYIGTSANTSSSSNSGYKRKGACYICQDPWYYAPDCPNKKEKPQSSQGYPENTGNQTIAQRKENTNCFLCGEKGHWDAQCPIKDIPAFDQEFWDDLENFQELSPQKLKTED